MTQPNSRAKHSRRSRFAALALICTLPPLTAWAIVAYSDPSHPDGSGIGHTDALAFTILPTGRPRYSKIGCADPTILLPSGFSISIHHIGFAGNGSGAVAWMS